MGKAFLYFSPNGTGIFARHLPKKDEQPVCRTRIRLMLHWRHSMHHQRQLTKSLGQTQYCFIMTRWRRYESKCSKTPICTHRTWLLMLHHYPIWDQTITMKIDTIRNIKPPKTLMFLDIINYYRNMWVRWSHVLTPLTNLQSLDKPFIWTDVEQSTFDTIKKNNV